MKIINEPIFLKELQQMATTRFGNLVKAVVDVDKEIMALDAELHSDEEAALLEVGSMQHGSLGYQSLPRAPRPRLHRI